jgi:hypothetical protein
MKHTNITNSKNVISDSNIKVGGDFIQGNGKQYNRRTTININIGRIALGGGITISVGALVLYLLFPNFFETKEDATQNKQEVVDTPKVEASEKTISSVGETKPKQQPPKEEAYKPSVPAYQLNHYIDLSQSAKVVFYSTSQLKLLKVRSAVQSVFSASNISISNNALRPAFRSSFGSSLKAIDFSTLNALGLPQHLNCICQLVEDVRLEKGEMEGTTIWTARGTVEVLLYHTNSGELTTTVINAVPRAGVSETAALESFEELLLNNRDLTNLNVSLCK